MKHGKKGVRPDAPYLLKKAPQNYFKINFAESKKVSTFAVPTEGNSNERDARSDRKMTHQPYESRDDIQAEARCPGDISSLNDHVAQRLVREYDS